MRPLPCPPGKGRCRGARSTLFALRAKALQSGAPDHGISRKRTCPGAFSPSKDFPDAPGNGETGFSPQGTEFSRTPSAPRSPNEPLSTRNGYMRHLTDETRSFPLQNLPHLSICGKRGLLQGTSPRHRFSLRTSGARPSPAFHPLQNPSFPPFPPPPHPPTIPPGERRALPAPAQGSRPLRIPFWGTALISPSPVPQNAAGGRPLLVGLPPCTRSAAGQKRNEAPKPPTRGAWVREHVANGTGRRHCRPRT